MHSGTKKNSQTNSDSPVSDRVDGTVHVVVPHQHIVILTVDEPNE